MMNKELIGINTYDRVFVKYLELYINDMEGHFIDVMLPPVWKRYQEIQHEIEMEDIRQCEIDRRQKYESESKKAE